MPEPAPLPEKNNWSLERTNLPLPINSFTGTSELFLGLEMRGYRSFIADWDVNNSDVPVLRPVHRGRLNPWKPGVNIAECYPRRDHQDTSVKEHCEPIPHEPCGCGFWAYYTPDGSDRRHLTMDAYASSLVTGVVRASGEVVQFEDGWRAEKAEILAIAPPAAINAMLSAVLSSGGVDWVSWATRAINHAGYCPCIHCKHQRGKFPPGLKALAQRYGVPYYDTFDDMCEAHKPTHETSLTAPLGFWSTILFPQTGNVTVNKSFRAYAMSVLGRTCPENNQAVTLIGTSLGLVETSVTGWTAQPAFTGSSAAVVQKFWRWNLTGAVS
jgi:hypothetical protein